jgi:dihydroxynaphthoic acid synthetase
VTRTAPTTMETPTLTSEHYGDITFEVVDQIAWLTIDRPRWMNAFREHTLDEIIHALRSVREDRTVAAVVITGTGDKAFSAGGDFHAMMRLNKFNGHLWNERMLETAMTIRGLHVPVIAMVNGYCMGGGHELALWCDVVIASENAVFGQTGAKVGACPTVGATQYLPRIIGERLAREMIFMARTFTAEEAVSIGLANKVVPQAELRAATLEWCERLKGHSGQTLRATKISLNSESDELYASWRHGMELLNNIWGTDESLEGMQAFLDKRKPDFQRFRLQNAEAVNAYVEGLERGENQHPDARVAAG